MAAVPQSLAKLRSIVVHHSASARSTTADQIDRWHRDRGFMRIGYHFVIEEDGTLRYGRPIDMVPAAQGGANTGTIAVCITGDNTRGDRQWNDHQRWTFRRLVEDIRRLLGRPLPVVGHRDAAHPDHPTLCPGVDVDATFPSINQ